MAVPRGLKAAIVCFVVAVAGVQLYFSAVLSRLKGPNYCYWRRVKTTINYEFIMVPISMFIWARIVGLANSGNQGGELPMHHDGRVKKRSRAEPPSTDLFLFIKLFRFIMLVSALAIVIFSHVAPLTFYFERTSRRSGFTTFCFTCLGAYMNLFFTLVAVSFFNLLMRLIVSSSLMNKLLKPCLKSTCLRAMLLNAHVQTALALFASGFLVVLGIISTSGSPIPNEVRIKIKDLPYDFHGFRIALLSDLHIGPNVGAEELENAVHITNSLKPDLVAIVGDLVDGTVHNLKDDVKMIKSLVSTQGTYFVTGNHEYYFGDVDNWLKYVSGLNVRPLRNSAVRLYANEDARRRKTKDHICLAGVDDIAADHSRQPDHGFHVNRALEGCSRNEPVILLSHNPVGAVAAIKYVHANSTTKYNLSLVISGHTHGGQMLVLAPLVYLLNPLIYGLYHMPTGEQIYVGPGVFYMPTRMKIYGMMQIPLIILERAS